MTAPRKVWVSLPLLDPALVRAMARARYDRRKLRRRFLALIRAALARQPWGHPAIGVTLRGTGNPMAHPRFVGPWEPHDAARAAFVLGECTGLLLLELSTLAMKQACAGELEPKRGRYKR